VSPSAPRMGLKNFIWTQWCFRNPGNRERRRPRVRRPAANSPLLGRALHISAGAVFRNINRHMVRYIIITLTITSVPLDRSPFQLLAQALPWQPFGTLALAGATDSDESSIMKRVVETCLQDPTTLGYRFGSGEPSMVRKLMACFRRVGHYADFLIAPGVRRQNLQESR
jgi:hypothetical protein